MYIYLYGITIFKTSQPVSRNINPNLRLMNLFYEMQVSLTNIYSVIS